MARVGPAFFYVCRKFDPKHYRTYDWIHFDLTRKALFCYTCGKAHQLGLLNGVKNPQAAFTTKGYSNWKDLTAGLSDHANSTMHEVAVNGLETLRKGDVASQINRGDIQGKAKARLCLVEIFKAVRFLARQGLALRGDTSENSNFYQLCALSLETSGHSDWLHGGHDHYTSPDIQNEMVEMMASATLEEIRKGFTSANFFAIIADECRDISLKEQVTVCLRSVLFIIYF